MSPMPPSAAVGKDVEMSAPSATIPNIDTDALVGICSKLRSKLQALLIVKRELGSQGQANAPLASSATTKSEGESTDAAGADADAKDDSTSRARLVKDFRDATLMLVDLKSASRGVFMQTEEMRKQVEAIKKKTEASSLGLQNLLYEKAFLLKEISRCKEYTTDETDKVELCDEATFESKAPEHLRTVSKTESEHSYHLNRLSHEMLMRKQLKTELASKQIECKKVSASISEKRGFLDGMPARLSDIANATKPLQKYMKMPVAKQLALREECRQLPAALYVVYCQLQTYGQSFENLSVRVAPSEYTGPPSSSTTAATETATVTTTKSGDKRKSSGAKSATKKRAAHRESTQPSPSPNASPISNEDDEDDDMNEGGEAGGDAVVDVYRPAQLAVTARLRSHENDGKDLDLILRFQYLPELDTVTVEADGQSGLLANLFPNDTGEIVPRAGASIRRFSSQLRARPYKWVQWLAGLYHLESVSEGYAKASKPTEPPTREIISRILSRVHSQEVLSKHLAVLAKCPQPVPVHPSAGGLFPAKAVASLSSWKEVSADEAAIEDELVTGSSARRGVPVISIQPYDASVPAVETAGVAQSSAGGKWQAFGSRYFRGEMKFGKGGKQCVQAAVQVFMDYPRRAPRFTLKRVSGTGKSASQASTVDDNLRTIQIELNAYAGELTTSSCDGKEQKEEEGTGDFLLLHQLRRLQMCLDVLAGDVEADRMFGRAMRGRDRRMPFVFDQETKLFVHR